MTRETKQKKIASYLETALSCAQKCLQKLTSVLSEQLSTIIDVMGKILNGHIL